MIWWILIAYVFGFVLSFKYLIKDKAKRNELDVTNIYGVSFFWFIIFPIAGISLLKDMMDDRIKKMILTEQERHKKKETANKNRSN